MVVSKKPLNRPAYGSIPHLPGSKLGPGEHTLPPGQVAICTEKTRDKHDNVVVQEKLDGSCVAVANIHNQIVPLIRAGYPAILSKYSQHRLFAYWVADNEARFLQVLKEGQRLVGEWLAQAHGTIYSLKHEPFVAFDLMVDTARMPHKEFIAQVAPGKFITPHVIGACPMTIAAVQQHLLPGNHGATIRGEGAVWRVERAGKVDFLAKWVWPDNIPGKYLPEISGMDPVWHL